MGHVKHPDPLIAQQMFIVWAGEFPIEDRPNRAKLTDKRTPQPYFRKGQARSVFSS
jgi:hypothetical protein